MVDRQGLNSSESVSVTDKSVRGSQVTSLFPKARGGCREAPLEPPISTYSPDALLTFPNFRISTFVRCVLIIY